MIREEKYRIKEKETKGNSRTATKAECSKKSSGPWRQIKKYSGKGRMTGKAETRNWAK